MGIGRVILDAITSLAYWWIVGRGPRHVQKYKLEPHEEIFIKEKLREFDDIAPGATEFYIFKGNRRN